MLGIIKVITFNCKFLPNFINFCKDFNQVRFSITFGLVKWRRGAYFTRFIISAAFSSVSFFLAKQNRNNLSSFLEV